MKILVFLPTDETLEPYPFGEFEFDVMPREGQVLRFNDFDDADYPVERTGFIQEEKFFVGAVWLGPPRLREAQVEIITAEAGEEASNSES